ncbi:MAG: Fe-S-containing protein [bacterium]|nr:Fe-S-containing protein [bacterium]
MGKSRNVTNHQGKKYWPIFVVIVAVLIVGGFFLLRKPEKKDIGQSQCQVKEIIFYYLDGCEWCQKVKNEGTLEKIEQLGIKVTKINAAIGPVRHKFQGVPTFVINEKVYSGYRTFEELKELFACQADNEQNPQAQPSPVQAEKPFLGEKGGKVVLENGEVGLSAVTFNDNKARFYNIEMPNGKTIYFFVVKDKNNIYRAAANACQVCFGERKGFRQEGDEIVCNNCGNRYPIEKIATEKGGCNPGPINPNLEVRNEDIIIKQVDLERVLDLMF